MSSPQEEEEEEEEEAVPVEVDDEGDILFTKITRSPQHADDGYDEDDSVPIAVLFNNNKKKKQPVEETMEVDVLPAPRLIRDKVVYKVELHVPGVAIDVAAVHKPAPVKKVVIPSSSSLLKNMTDWNRSAVRTALLQPPLATLHLRIPLRPRHSFYSSTTNAAKERDHAYDDAAPSSIQGPIRPDALARSLIRGPYWTKKNKLHVKMY